MLLLIGSLISLGLTAITYFASGLYDKSLWFLLLAVLLFFTYFIAFLNVYWAFVIIGTLPYRGKEFTGKVNKFWLFNIGLIAGFIIPLQGIILKKKSFKMMPKEPGLILFNHVSDFDPWVLYTCLKGKYSFVGKLELKDIPIIGQLSASIGTLYVDDNNKEVNYRMVDNAVEYIKNKKTSVVIAPEGTRNKTGKIKPFKHGGFNIAKRAKCPIVLVGFKGMENVLKKTTAFSKVEVGVFDVIYPEQYETLSAGQIANLCEDKYLDYLGQK